MLRRLSPSPGTEVPGSFFPLLKNPRCGPKDALNISFHPRQSTVIEMTTLERVNGTTCNAQEYQQSLPSPTNPDPSITCLSHGQSIGLAVGTVILSSTSQLFLNLAYICVARCRGIFRQFHLCTRRFYSNCSMFLLAFTWLSSSAAYWICIQRNILRHRVALRQGDLRLFRTHADIYIVCLITAGAHPST